MQMCKKLYKNSVDSLLQMKIHQSRITYKNGSINSHETQTNY